MRYGIWDPIDQCWLGDGTGPKTFGAGDVVGEDRELDDDGARAIARVSAEIACVQLGWPRNRCQVREYDGSGTKLKDELPAKDTTENVLRKLERGAI